MIMSESKYQLLFKFLLINCCVLEVALAFHLVNFKMFSDKSSNLMSGETVFENMGTGFSSSKILQEP